MISFDYLVLRDPYFRSALGDDTAIIDTEMVSSTSPEFGQVVAEAYVPTGQEAPWPLHMKMGIATGAYREHREVGKISGTAGRFALEWKTVAEHLAEALRLGTAEQVEQALDLFDSTKEALEGPEDVPPDVEEMEVED